MEQNEFDDNLKKLLNVPPPKKDKRTKMKKADLPREIDLENATEKELLQIIIANQTFLFQKVAAIEQVIRVILDERPKVDDMNEQLLLKTVVHKDEVLELLDSHLNDFRGRYQEFIEKREEDK